jgi:hypothetical protein
MERLVVISAPFSLIAYSGVAHSIMLYNEETQDRIYAHTRADSRQNYIFRLTRSHLVVCV